MNPNFFSFIETHSELISSSSYPALLQSFSDVKKNHKVIVLLATDTKMTNSTGISTTNRAMQMNNDDFSYSLTRQIKIWFPIGIILILYFAVMMLVQMPIQKSSILYANYISKKGNMN